MSFISYAQNFEDVMLWRALGHVAAGTYVDVGAQHPVVDSVSKAFYERGWRGTHIEPVPEFADMLRHDRPDETVLQVALGAAEGTLELNVFAHTGLSTAVDEHARRHHDENGMEVNRIAVPVLTLKSGLQALSGKDVHWLKIDVEGYEEQVLRGWDSSQLRPWVMVIEATVPGSPDVDCAAWDPLLVAANYRFVYFDGLNRFYIAAEHDELAAAFSCPPNVFDRVELSGLASSTLCRGVTEKYRTELASVSAEMGIMVPQLLQANARLAAGQHDAGSLHAEAEMARRQLDLLAAEAGAARTRCQLLEGHIKMMQGEWNLAATKVAQSQSAVNEWWNVAHNLNMTLMAMHASTSWRLTLPLREAKRVARRVAELAPRLAHRLAELPARLARKTSRIVRQAAKSLLVRTMRATLAHPGLTARALLFLQHRPRLRQSLYQLAARAGVIQRHSAQAPPPRSGAKPDQITPRAARIYAQLEEAVQESKD
jgi:FkbM family methyltransferase